MSDIAKRPSRTPRRVREKRGYQLVMVGGVAGLVAAVSFLLALFTSFGWGLFLISAIIAAVCFVMFRNMTQRR